MESNSALFSDTSEAEKYVQGGDEGLSGDGNSLEVQDDVRNNH